MHLRGENRQSEALDAFSNILHLGYMFIFVYSHPLFLQLCDQLTHPGHVCIMKFLLRDGNCDTLSAPPCLL